MNTDEDLLSYYMCGIFRKRTTSEKKKKHYRKKKCFIHKKEERKIHCSLCKILTRKYCNRSFPHCNPTAVEKCQQHQIYTDMAGRSLMQIPLPYMESVERSADSGTGNGWVWFNKAAIFYLLKLSFPYNHLECTQRTCIHIRQSWSGIKLALALKWKCMPKLPRNHSVCIST